MINDEDKRLFRDSVDTSAPIDKDGQQQTNQRISRAAFTAYSYITEARLSGSKIVAHAKNGLSPKLIKKMKHGTIDFAPTLDLHGQTVVEACESMSQFMYHHQHEEFIHIIHGKGYHSDNSMSILKTQVVSFLSQHPQVMAFNSCPDKDGGTGAVFALLKQ
ncbi:Smr domain protein [uncultured Gammaproteobacteria bacterium]|uniref:Smr/MutS family protein n=1 Tax=Bathymodiolus heckerae thiotrophic gill symbiont TaxID=1052212 RepID=UPI0010B1F090|nr:Smr/MutS family protein [Bathymodiolus heckerae thiotrophic gill symbiont]CAC9601271.1 Smr domain protein [uncultured Gammaproteobacteria bacterium]SHN89336.1 Smr domain protein [Bathymodiolus heckerae thiotrophic gill symbiont]